MLLEESEEANRDGKDSLSLLIGSVYDLLVEDGKCVGISLQDGT